MLSDIRGSLKDIADSYISGNILSSSVLISKLNNVEIIRKDIEICSGKKIFYISKISDEVSLSIVKNNNYEYYFCFSNKFYSNYKGNRLEIAEWINGYPVNYTSLSDYLKHIFVLSLVITSLSILILYKLLQKQEYYRKKQITKDLVSKIKHEINRPISRIQFLLKSIYSPNELGNYENINDKIYQMFLLTKTHGFLVNSMFSYAMEKNNLKNVVEKNTININNIFDYCLNISIKNNVKNLDVKKNISNFFDTNLVIIDKVFLEISISNIFTNAFEAVYRNYNTLNKDSELDIFRLEIFADYEIERNRMTIEIKNFGSYIPENNFDDIFIPGITSDKNTNTGYGLSILKEIVDSYSGEVKVFSFLNKKDFKNSWVSFKLTFNDIEHISISKKEIKNLEYIYDKKINILVSDDDIYFLNYFKSIFKNFSNFNIKYFLTVQESCAYIRENNDLDLAIIDMEFDKDPIGGKKISEAIISKNTRIIFHTSFLNQSFIKKYEFYQKIISKERVLEIIDEIYQHKYSNNDKYQVIILDDEPHILNQWKQINPDIDFLYFNQYDDLFDYIDREKIDLSNIKLILTDYYFDKIKLGLNLLSNDNLTTLREIYDYEGYIVLFTNAPPLQNIKHVNATISKSPINLSRFIDELKSY